MEEIRKAALAYYNNLPKDLQKLTSAKFKEIDSSGDGTISIEEFKKSMGSSFHNNSVIMERSFKELDNNGDRKLDFNEYITLYYLVESGRVLIYCAGKGCKAASFLKGLYFTCVDCFDHNKNGTFDLCTSCYDNADFVHENTNFVDNHVLLRSKAACCESTSEPCSPGPDSDSNRVSRTGSKRRALLGFIKSGASVARAVGNMTSDVASCSIM